MTEKTAQAIETTVSFGVSSRLVAILGQHLIRDNTVGLMELIKNGFDADAGLVSVEMYDLADPDQTRIIVQDDGVGMTREVLTGPWLTVAHGHKEEAKGRAQRSFKGRMPLGEKGVGRFAVHKLGRRLLMITRPLGFDLELVLEIDWDEFEEYGGAIGQVPLRLTERMPQHFVGPDAHGTCLVMSVARERWQRRDVAKLQASLMRLTSPRFGVSGFEVRLRCEEFPDLERIEARDITDRYQFRLDCGVNENGLCFYEYRWRDANREEQSTAGAVQLWPEPDRKPACGPFRLDLTAWLMNQKLLQDLGTSREQINALSGISIYRDGFRILPYGDEGDDWVGLDARRINNPSVRFGNKQMIGTVLIDQVANRNLIDKTNREGLQENHAYEDLKRMVLAVINTIEQLSLRERQKRHQSEVQRKQLLSDQMQHLDETVARLDVQPFPVSAASADNVTAQVIVPGKVLVDVEEIWELQRTAKAVHESALQIAGMQQEEKGVYLQLLGTGLAAERYIHEVDRQLGLAINAVGDLRVADLSGKAAQASRQLDLFVNSLRSELRLLGQLRYVQRSQRVREVSVIEITEFLILSRDAEIRAAGIRLVPSMDDDLKVHMVEAQAAQVIGNILDNAIYWLSQDSLAGGRKLRIDLNPVERSLTISNNGREVSEVVRDLIFERPFVTMKEEGHGLGLYLSAEIMRRAGGSLELLSGGESPLAGPAFVVRFPPTES